ncbi:hypothetical protein EMCRGX_G008958 [Ephydatia muelleri]
MSRYSVKQRYIRSVPHNDKKGLYSDVCS